MKDFISKIIKLIAIIAGITCAILLFWVVISAYFTLITPIDYSGALFLTAITFGAITYAVYATKKLSDDQEIKRRQNAHNCIILQLFGVVSNPHWNSKIVVPMKPEEIDGGFIADPELPFQSTVCLRISSTNPLTATDKTILKSAIQTDLNYWVTNHMIPCQRVFVQSLHVQNQFLFVYLEVTL
jgi:hypothetical protein